ncbi:membrane-bound lytic murein transglycosylase C [Desulfobotulus alkaliphilus]|uniref:Membrane-bound lytic murein transglycosylase C n=1 Tax=Desulfobotulus alkaliphilus TaxID=622671 RepID=A0A562RNP7_9BACT|nr:murein transglycosylase domain-containing protein [Desulfobotulus alkaliphilus]TWI70687.1 membrane-bound lytic murein transglycosylase C [Desulfobotulus alkaliphilus]
MRFLPFGILALVFPAIMVMPPASPAQSFEEYMKQQQSAFVSYQEQINRDFQEYQRIIEEEFSNFKKQVQESWGDEIVSTPTQWVEYSRNMKNRTLVDYENSTITVEIQAPEKAENLHKELQERVRNLVTATSASAFENDTLSRNIEKRITEASDNVLTDKVKPEPVLTKELTGTDRPSNRQINRTVNELVQKSVATQRPAPDPGNRIHAFTITLPDARLSDKGDAYEREIIKYSRERKIDPALVVAIMHSESSFNPMAKSHIPAYGLMQIVPRSAGKDASQLVYGEQKLLSPSYLYNADNNIKMGVAYLHILYYRYLSSIQNPESRLYCSIAAYNTGAGNVARAFIGNTNIRRAAETINRMTPEQVYNKLVADLPYEETRNYMKKVTPRYKGYQARFSGR